MKNQHLHGLPNSTANYFENLLKYYTPKTKGHNLQKNIDLSRFQSNHRDQGNDSSKKPRPNLALKPDQNAQYRKAKMKSDFKKHLYCPQAIEINEDKHRLEQKQEEFRKQISERKKSGDDFIMKEDIKYLKPMVVDKIYDEEVDMNIKATQFIKKLKQFNKTRDNIFHATLRKEMDRKKQLQPEPNIFAGSRSRQVAHSALANHAVEEKSTQFRSVQSAMEHM